MTFLCVTLALCALTITAAIAYDLGHQAASRTHMRIMDAIRMPPMSNSKRKGD